MPLHRAILFKHIYCLRLLIEHGADTNAFLPPSSHQFLQRGDRCHDEIRELSLSKGITPLSLATNGDDEVNVIAMKMLLENGADPNYFFEERGEHLCRDWTIKRRESDTKLGSTLLTSVCAPYYWSFAKALIEAGANVNVVAKTDNTNPLYWAVRCSNLTMLTSLLDHGADPNLPSPSHCLHTAILQGSEEMAIELANRGSDLNAKDGQGKTPLQRAEQCGLLLVVEAIRILSGLST